MYVHKQAAQAVYAQTLTDKNCYKDDRLIKEWRYHVIKLFLDSFTCKEMLFYRYKWIEEDAVGNI